MVIRKQDEITVKQVKVKVLDPDRLVSRVGSRVLGSEWSQADLWCRAVCQSFGGTAEAEQESLVK